MVGKQTKKPRGKSPAGKKRLKPGPWAAYVCGHHPFSLHTHFEELWLALRVDPPHCRSNNQKLLQSITRESTELEHALATLEGLQVKREDVLPSVMRAWACCKVSLTQTVDNRDWLVPEDGVLPAEEEWETLEWLQSKLTGPSEDLDRWRRLGEKVGGCQLWVGTRVAFGEDDLPPEFGDLRALASEFSSGPDLAIGSSMAKAVAAVRNPFQVREYPILGRGYVFTRLRGFQSLHEEIDAYLRTRPSQEPILVLGPDKVGFCGATRRTQDVGRAVLGCLWVLGKYAGEPVTRETILEEGEFDCGGPINVKSPISLARKLLRNLFEEAVHSGIAQQTTLPPDSFITGLRDRDQKHGPYRLCLSREQVRINGPLP